MATSKQLPLQQKHQHRYSSVPIKHLHTSRLGHIINTSIISANWITNTVRVQYDIWKFSPSFHAKHTTYVHHFLYSLPNPYLNGTVSFTKHLFHLQTFPISLRIFLIISLYPLFHYYKNRVENNIYRGIWKSCWLIGHERSSTTIKNCAAVGQVGTNRISIL